MVHEHKCMSRYQRWGGTDKHRCSYKGLYMQTEKQMGRQVCLSVLAEKSTCLHGQDFLERKIKTNKYRKKIKAPVLYFNLNYCYRHFRGFDKWCDNVMDLSENMGRRTLHHMMYYRESPSLTFDWIKLGIEIILPYALLPWKSLWCLLTRVSLCIQ